MAQKNRSEMRKLVRACEKQGLEVSRTGSGHWKVANPRSGKFTYLSFSPGARGTNQTLKQLRRVGFRPEA